MSKQPGYSQTVYYISLLASDEFGKPRNQYFTFDEASKLDLKCTNVIVLDVHQLKTRYRHGHPEVSEKVIEKIYDKYYK